MLGTKTARGLLGKSAMFGLLAMLLAALGGLAGTALAGPAAQVQSDMQHLEMLSGKNFEIDFISMMIEHHQSALDMARLVPDRANHQQLKEVAQNIIRDQTREINNMTGWLQQWYNTAPKQGMMHEMPGMGTSNMTNLQSFTGDAFDKEFLTMMRMHHMGAVEMANLVPARAVHGELMTLARNIISSQTAEIQEFESWAKSWYSLDLTQGNVMKDPMSGGSMSGSPTSSSTSGSGEPAGMPRTGSGENGGWLASFLSLLALVLAAISVAGGVWLRKRA